MKRLRLVGYCLWVLAVSLSLGAAFYFLSAQKAQAVREVQCTNGFQRPLLFGINPSDRDDADITIPDTGGTMTSVNFSWDKIEPVQAQMNYSEPDSKVKKYDTAKLVIVGSLSGTPAHVLDNPIHGSSAAPYAW